MQIAIIHNPTSTHANTWKQWLESANYKVDTVHDYDTFQYAKKIKYDLIIPLITIQDYIHKRNVRMEAMSYFESKGLKLLTPPTSIAASSDKLKTAETLYHNSLPHPTTSPFEDFTLDDAHFPLILKPRFGHSGHEIHLIQNESEFNKYKRYDMIVQEFVEYAECIRIISSESEVLSAYKKVPPVGEFIANIDRGATRMPLTLSGEMKQLAQSVVRVLGGGLMGVDLLDSPRGLFVLEANVPFGFDKNDVELRKNLVTFIKKEVQ